MNTLRQLVGTNCEDLNYGFQQALSVAHEMLRGQMATNTANRRETCSFTVRTRTDESGPEPPQRRPADHQEDAFLSSLPLSDYCTQTHFDYAEQFAGKVFIWQESERIDESGESKERGWCRRSVLTSVLIWLFMAFSKCDAAGTKHTAAFEPSRQNRKEALSVSTPSVLHVCTVHVLISAL